jgi:thiol-disulfide isomerase/thioredoxin
MKTIFLISFALALSFFAYSQNIIEKPKVGISTAPYVKIEKIELRDTATVIWFHVIFQVGSWIHIPKETYIQPVGSNEKLFIVSTDGIPLNVRYTIPASGEVDYKLVFPKIESSVGKLDYGEGNEGGSWFIYNIQLKPELFKSVLPEKITGNWFRSDNAQWEISLFDSVAIYKSQVWKIKQYSEKEGVGKIGLKNGSKSLYIFTKPINDSTCKIGETPAKLVKYSHQPNELVVQADKELYKLPVFKIDTVTYCGYVKGYDSRFPKGTVVVYVNDVLTGERNSFPLKISDDGSFKTKIPLSNPQWVSISGQFFGEPVFGEPGKAIFQLIDNGNQANPVLFMGDCARINSDLLKLKSIDNFEYNQRFYNILDFSPEQYKSGCQELLQKRLEALADYARAHPISAKAVQIKQLEVTYWFNSHIIGYGWSIDEAYRKKNNIPKDQREIPFELAKPDSSYYTFLTGDLVNNPIAVLSPSYAILIKQLMFLDYLKINSRTYSLPEIADEMNKVGYQLTPQEEELTIQMRGVDTPEFKKVQDEFQQKFGQQSKDFDRKYLSHIQAYFRERGRSVNTSTTLPEYLMDKKVDLTEAEKSYLAAVKQFRENPLVTKRNNFYMEFNKQIRQFQSDHSAFINGLVQESRIDERNEKIQTMLGIQPGFATDLMASMELCRTIVVEMTPVSDEKLRKFQKKITTPFIASFIELKNNETKARIEANKKLTGSTVNDVPKATVDKLFDVIMEKYKGKVVYVDFWATWCSPCRAGIERIKPLKDEMANENVAFVYITNQTSPKGTYDNMIPTIKGEHYRVSQDEWNNLCGKFKISGIPHYVLVGKDGKVINPQLGHLENSQLKTLLMKCIKE